MVMTNTATLLERIATNCGGEAQEDRLRANSAQPFLNDMLHASMGTFAIQRSMYLRCIKKILCLNENDACVYVRWCHIFFIVDNSSFFMVIKH